MCIRQRICCGLRHWFTALCLFALGLIWTPLRAHAADPVSTAAAATAAAPAVTATGQLVGNLAEIPLATADIVKLPMGVVECVFAPLPGVEFMSGLRHIGTGLLGPFRLVIGVLTLPASIANTVTGTGNSLAGKK